MIQTDEGLTTKLVNLRDPILKVPNLCIHLQSAEERVSSGPPLLWKSGSVESETRELVRVDA